MEETWGKMLLLRGLRVPRWHPGHFKGTGKGDLIMLKVVSLERS